jgi:hypothetical protein
VQCELHPNNKAAIWRARELRKAVNVIDLFVMSEDGEIVFTNRELFNECDKQREISGAE